MKYIFQCFLSHASGCPFFLQDPQFRHCSIRMAFDICRESHHDAIGLDREWKKEGTVAEKSVTHKIILNTYFDIVWFTCLKICILKWDIYIYLFIYTCIVYIDHKVHGWYCMAHSPAAQHYTFVPFVVISHNLQTQRPWLGKGWKPPFLGANCWFQGV